MVAILFVLLGHVNTMFYHNFQYDWFNMGNWERTGGVDFFFIVSGFMIFYIYHKQASIRGKTTEFLLKRMIKIFPLYWLFTLSLVTVSIIFPSAHYTYSLKNIITSMLFLSSEPILDSTWSLRHIMFFYLLFSHYIYRPNIFKPVIYIWTAATVMIELKFIPFLNDSFIFSFSTFEILLGCFAAYLALNFTINYSSLILTIGIIGYLGIWINNIYSFLQIHEPLFYCLFSMVIMLAIFEKDKRNNKIPRIISYLGDASYSIYIAHFPLLMLYTYIFGELQIITFIGYFNSMLIITLLKIFSCCLIYTYIEQPMSNYLKKTFLINRTTTK